VAKGKCLNSGKFSDDYLLFKWLSQIRPSDNGTLRNYSGQAPCSITPRSVDYATDSTATKRRSARISELSEWEGGNSRVSVKATVGLTDTLKDRLASIVLQEINKLLNEPRIGRGLCNSDTRLHGSVGASFRSQRFRLRVNCCTERPLESQCLRLSLYR
jgi:hypothetical protein